MEQMPLIGPDAGELVPLLIAVVILSVIMFWPNIKPYLRGLWPTQRRTVRGRRQVRKTTAPRSSSTPSVDLPARPASLSRRRDLRPRPRAGAATVKAKSLSAETTADPAPTRTWVTALPAAVPWPLDDARLDCLPVIFDGKLWHGFDVTASRHAVICGASRSGKGNLLQLLALEALRQGPERVQVWFLDPKGGLDYAAFLPLPHARVYAGVAGKGPFNGDLTAGYKEAIQEMQRRNDLLLAAGARTHHEYRMRTGESLPYLILICDEVANLEPAQQKLLVTLAQMSAASGIVVWAATQYPTADSLPSQMQANALDRIVFQFPSPRYTPVALGLAPGERPVYEPSAIDRRGVCILRQDGRDVAIGVTPLVDDQRRTSELWSLQLCYTRPPLRQEAVATVATPHQDAVAAIATKAATGSATVAATAPEAPISAEIAPVEEVRAEASSATENEKDRKKALAVKLAAEGQSQDQIRQALVEKFGSAVAQSRLVEWWREGRAQIAQQSDGNDRAAEAAAEPVKDSTGGPGQIDTSAAPLSKLAAAA